MPREDEVSCASTTRCTVRLERSGRRGRTLLGTLHRGDRRGERRTRTCCETRQPCARSEGDVDGVVGAMHRRARCGTARVPACACARSRPAGAALLRLGPRGKSQLARRSADHLIGAIFVQSRACLHPGRQRIKRRTSVVGCEAKQHGGAPMTMVHSKRRTTTENVRSSYSSSSRLRCLATKPFLSGVRSQTSPCDRQAVRRCLERRLQRIADCLVTDRRRRTQVSTAPTWPGPVLQPCGVLMVSRWTYRRVGQRNGATIVE